MDIKDRIRIIMEDKHMTQQVFADFLQQSPATLSSIFNGRTRPTLNIIDSIKTKIPDISIEWLLYGTGDMYISHPDAADPGLLEGQNSAQEPMINFDSPAPVVSQVLQNPILTSPYQQGVKSTHAEITKEEVKIIDKTPRKVTEIRVYYDDQTYETFVPAKK
jgi:transcriptional regulator with XRE-family HTH domain